MALCIAATVVSADAGAQVSGQRRAVAAARPVEKSLPMPAAIPAKAEEPQRKPSAAVAVTLTDDADSMRLPAFATRTTPLPTRFLRVGIEWSF